MENHSDNKNDSKLLGRRRALQILGVGVAAGGLFALAACKGNNGDSAGSAGSASTGTDDCTTDIDDNSKTLRRTLQYNDKAAVPEKHCSACVQFIDGKYGKCGGGCKVIPGPVNPNGGCLSFAPKGAAPAASSG